MFDKFYKNNKGITLVELIVVTSIIAVLASAAVHSLGLISSSRAKQFVSECESMIARCKVNTVAGVRDATFLMIYQESDGTFYGGLYEGGVEVLKQELGQGIGCTIDTVEADGTTIVDSYTIGVGRAVCLGFNRTTGAFEPLSKYPDNLGIDGVYLQKINVSYGLNTFTITLVPATGYYFTN